MERVQRWREGEGGQRPTYREREYRDKERTETDRHTCRMSTKIKREDRDQQTNWEREYRDKQWEDRDGQTYRVREYRARARTQTDRQIYWERQYREGERENRDRPTDLQGERVQTWREGGQRET